MSAFENAFSCTGRDINAGIARTMTRTATMTQCCLRLDSFFLFSMRYKKTFLCEFSQNSSLELCLKLLWHNFPFAFFLSAFLLSFAHSPYFRGGCMFIICKLHNLLRIFNFNVKLVLKLQLLLPLCWHRRGNSTSIIFMLARSTNHFEMS